jgi:signal transduction histidine kinase
VTAIVDPRRLERIAENLLQNATRHGAPPVSVTVGTTWFAVRDHGAGFSPAMLDGATDRFRSGDASRRGGVGLGLSIVAAQTAVLGGMLRLANAVDGGAVVTVALPDVPA